MFMSKVEDLGKLSQDLQARQGCKVQQELQGIPFEEQIRILQQAEKMANQHYVSQPTDIMDQNRVTAYDDFSTNPVSVTKSYGWGDIFNFAPLYNITLDLKTGKVSQSCNDDK